MKTYNELVEELCKEKGLMPHSQYPLANYDFFKEVLQRYTEQSNSHKHSVMQAEGSDGVEGEAVASSAVGEVNTWAAYCDCKLDHGVNKDGTCKLCDDLRLDFIV